jgi:hypothetical protein
VKAPKYTSQNWMSLVREPSQTGAEITELLSFWSVRACGLACATSAIEYFTGQQVSQITLFNQCVRNGGYSPGGWKHAELASLISCYGINAQAAHLPKESVVERVNNGEILITSVTHKFPDDGRKGGHLILVYGTRHINNQLSLRFMDPSGWGANNTTIAYEQFCKSFAMKGIVLTKKG